jgi:hypothetical protein
LGNIQRFALRDALHDVEQHDITEFLKADEMRKRATDLASADQRNFLAYHVGGVLKLKDSGGFRVLDLSVGAFKSIGQ